MKYNALVISGIVADVSQKELGETGSHQEIILENGEGNYAVIYECGDTPLSKETISGQMVTVPFELVKTEEFGTYKIKALEFLIKAEPSAADRIRAVSTAAASKSVAAAPASVFQGSMPNRRATPSFAKPGASTAATKSTSATGSKVAESIQNRLTQDLSTPVSDDPRVVIKDEDSSAHQGQTAAEHAEHFEGDAPNWEEVADSGGAEDLVAPKVAPSGKPNFSSTKPGFNPPKAGAGRASAPASFGKKPASSSATGSTTSAPQKTIGTKPLAAQPKTVSPAPRGFATAKPSKPRPNF